MTEAPSAATPAASAPAAGTLCLARTAQGRAVLQDRSVPLSRAGRNLLLVIEPGHAASHWLAQVRGATAEDLQTLLANGLVADPRPPAPPRITLVQALARLDYDTLYGRLTAEARAQLGLIQGLRKVLEIERATNVANLCTLALALVEQVRQNQGDAAAQALAQALADGRPA